MAKNTAIADAMNNAVTEKNIDLTAIDITKLDMGQILALQAKLAEEHGKRNEEIKKNMEEYINKEIESLRKRIITKFGDSMYFNISVSYHNTEIKESNTTIEKVPFKWFNPSNPQERWTGRGMSPKWVSQILEKEKINLETFKKDSRFLIPEEKTETKE